MTAPTTAMILSATLFATLSACTSSDKDSGEGGDGYADGISALGSGSNDLAAVRLDLIGAQSAGLDVPRDLEFNPEADGELWVVNQGDDSVSIFMKAGTDKQSSVHIVDPFALHFMEEVSSISFGAPGTFGTCQESRNTYNGQGSPNDFMGPTLWSSDLNFFGESNPEAVDYLSGIYGFEVDLGSHLDMQHESPNCVGIAWERDNRYWVFDGQEGSIDMVDFHDDHGLGFDDHSDGETATWLVGELSRVKDVHSGMVFDPTSNLLYVADTGNNRILVLDTTSGEKGDNRVVMEPGTMHYYVEGASSWDLATGADLGLVEPSGLDLYDGVLFVTDHATGTIVALDLQDGTELDRLDTGLVGLMGIEVRSMDEIYIVDSVANEVLRLSAAD